MKMFVFFIICLVDLIPKNRVNFEDKKSRLEIIQNIINRKLPVISRNRTFKDELFGSVNCNYKIGVIRFWGECKKN